MKSNTYMGLLRRFAPRNDKKWHSPTATTYAILNNMNKYLALMKKELILSKRQKHMLLSLLLFSTLVIMLIYFGLEALDVRPASIVASVVWLTVVFGGTLQLNRTYDFERDEDVLDGIRLISGTATVFYLSKLTVNLIILVAIMFFSSLITSILFGFTLEIGRMSIPMILGIIGMAAVGTTFSTMVMVHHKRDILLPTIFYPLIAPLSIAVIKAMLAGPGDRLPWLKILLAFDVIYVTASILVFDKVMGE